MKEIGTSSGGKKYVMRVMFLTEQGLCHLHLETHIKESRASRPRATALKCTSFAKFFLHQFRDQRRECAHAQDLSKDRLLACLTKFCETKREGL